MDHNNILTQSIESKFSFEILNQFGTNNFFSHSQIGLKLKELFDDLNNQYCLCLNTTNNNDGNYYLIGIRRKLYLGENHQILDDKIIELLNNKSNKELIKSFDFLIQYVKNIPYIESENDTNEDFLNTHNFMLELLHSTDIDAIDLESGIGYFEELKNNFRGRNKQAFEFYDNLQEKYFQLLESNFGVKYNNIPDEWN